MTPYLRNGLALSTILFELIVLLLVFCNVGAKPCSFLGTIEYIRFELGIVASTCGYAVIGLVLAGDAPSEL